MAGLPVVAAAHYVFMVKQIKLAVVVAVVA